MLQILLIAINKHLSFTCTGDDNVSRAHHLTQFHDSETIHAAIEISSAC